MKVKAFLGLLFILTLGFGCKKESTLEIDYPAPVPNFEVTYGAEGEVLFTNTSRNAVSFNWDFGNGNTSSSDSFTLSNTYQNKGSYNVTLTAKNVEGETASITKQIITTTEPWKPKIYKSAKISVFDVFKHPAANPAMELLRNQSPVVVGPPGGFRSTNVGMKWTANPPHEIINLDDNYVYRLMHFQQSENRYYLIADLPLNLNDYKEQKHPTWTPPTLLGLKNADGSVVVTVAIEFFE